MLFFALKGKSDKLTFLFAVSFKQRKISTIIAIAIFGRVITNQRAIQKRIHESRCTRPLQTIEQEIKSDNFCIAKFEDR